MARVAPGSPEADRIDAALALWRQGDVCLEPGLFWHVGDPDRALTSECARSGEFVLARLWRRALGTPSPLRAIPSNTEGFVVVSQTCDIVRACAERPFVEVAPLVAVDEGILGEVKKGRRPAYAFIPGVAERKLVADIDRIMTIEKAALLGWKRTSGWESDQQVRGIAQALARKRARFAFPDDFTLFVRKLQRRLTDKHGKNSAEGRALRALREIRVRAAPAWDAEALEVMYLFIRTDGELQFEGKEWHEHLEAWLKLVPSSGRFGSVDGQVTTLDDLTARDYVESDPLDLDHLSLPTES